jgi:hypothetical protein
MFAVQEASASMGGTWMMLTYGLAGMRDHDGTLSFWPRRAPEDNAILRFPVTYRGQLLEVEISLDKVEYALREGERLVAALTARVSSIANMTPRPYPTCRRRCTRPVHGCGKSSAHRQARSATVSCMAARSTTAGSDRCGGASTA